MLNEFLITLIKIFFFNISTTYGFVKIRKLEKVKQKEIIAFNILFAIIYSFLYCILRDAIKNKSLAYTLCYVIYIALISLVVNTKFSKGIKYGAISFALSCISFFIASATNFVVLKLLNRITTEYNMIEYITAGIIQLIITALFFKIKRFKDGFGFLQKDNKTIGIFTIVIGIATIFISVYLGIYTNNLFEMILITILIIGGIYLFYWIKKNITKYYKEKMKDRTVELQEEKLKEKDEEIKELKDELNKALEINHKYNHRLSAMEKAVGKLGNTLNFSEEYAKEYSNILDSLKEFSKEYKEEVEKMSNTDKLPKTNIFSLDNLLDYMKSEAEKEKIKFELEVNTDVDKLIKSKIEKGKLETLLADHIRDAIIAINSKDKPNGIIKVVLDKTNDIYEISISDNGIEFDIETLIKLGLEPITTHKISGGSGIGFMTTFETLNKCKASLAIKEFDPKDENNYTKEIVIRFDDRNEYRVESYRSAEIKEKDLRKRIIILDKYAKNI